MVGSAIGLRRFAELIKVGCLAISAGTQADSPRNCRTLRRLTGDDSGNDQ
jgi:hypothetical protein